jgi:RecB family exonuclease
MKSNPVKPYFLEQLAQTILKIDETKISDTTVVFPNQRSATLFTRYLSKAANKIIWSPNLESISAFIQKQSELELGDHLTLIFELHKTWNRIQKKSESFGQFYFWGEIILKDFNEIDRWLCDPKTIFKSVKDQKELDEHFNSLGEEELNALRSFWGSVVPKEKKDTISREKEHFMQLWENLYDLYHAFHEELDKQNMAYEGYIFRKFAERTAFPSGAESNIIFAGFNLLSTSEESIIKKYVEHYGAQVYWDADAWYTNRDNQEAGTFFRKYRSDAVLGKYFPKDLPDRISEKGEIYECALPSKSEQCLAASKEIQRLITEQNIPEEEIAIILPTEDLLFPLLNSLPPEVKKINITMGYPLSQTPWYSMIEYLGQLHQTQTQKNEDIHFWHLPVIALLKHPLLEDENSVKLSEGFKSANRIRISQKELFEFAEKSNSPKWKLIFSVMEEKDFPGHLLKIIRFITEHMQEGNAYYNINLDFSYQLYTQVSRLNDLVISESADPGEGGWMRLFQQILRQVKLPFSGEPLEGLQIMGVLESRNLDYQYVMILSMEEGNFPPTPENSTFIPFNLRKAFGLPLPNLQEAAYAYYFYRLLHHAKELYIYYSSAQEGMSSAEKSRFLLQVKHEVPSRNITPVFFQSPTQMLPSRTPELSYSNFPEAKTILLELLQNGISPSAINSLLDCKLKFAYKHLLKIEEPPEISEEINPVQMGNVLHKTMELLHDQLPVDAHNRRLMTKEHLENLLSQTEKYLNEAFSKVLFDNKPAVIEGKNLIIKNVLEKHVKRIIEKDIENSPLTLLSTEFRIEAFFETKVPALASKPIKIKFKGIIDRIDELDDRIRILDYKTGKDKREFSSISELFAFDSGKQNKAALQTMIYSWAWHQQNSKANKNTKPITPGLILTRELYNSEFDNRLHYYAEEKKRSPLEDIKILLPEIEEQMHLFFSEIGKDEFVFHATEEIAKCAYCPYVGICGR